MGDTEKEPNKKPRKFATFVHIFFGIFFIVISFAVIMYVLNN
jgi:hypothetical protein